jgi:N6-adenosine-specific RNA methylase IME4
MDDLERTIVSLLELKQDRKGRTRTQEAVQVRHSFPRGAHAAPVGELARSQSTSISGAPTPSCLQGLRLMEAWGFEYKTMLVWYKVRRDGGPDGRGVGFYFRDVTEPLLFGVRGRLRTRAPGRRQVNILIYRKREHSTKPPVVYEVIQSCSPGPYLELFARRTMPNWVAWGDEVDTYEQQKPRYRECDWGIGIPLTLDELWDRYRGPGRLDPRTFWRDCQGG